MANIGYGLKPERDFWPSLSCLSHPHGLRSFFPGRKASWHRRLPHCSHKSFLWHEAPLLLSLSSIQNLPHTSSPTAHPAAPAAALLSPAASGPLLNLPFRPGILHPISASSRLFTESLSRIYYYICKILSQKNLLPIGTLFNSPLSKIPP